MNLEIKESTSGHYIGVNGELIEIADVRVDFCGVKSEMPTSEIRIKQSQTDRRPVDYDPVRCVRSSSRLPSGCVSSHPFVVVKGWEHSRGAGNFHSSIET